MQNMFQNKNSFHWRLSKSRSVIKEAFVSVILLLLLFRLFLHQTELYLLHKAPLVNGHFHFNYEPNTIPFDSYNVNQNIFPFDYEPNTIPFDSYKVNQTEFHL